MSSEKPTLPGSKPDREVLAAISRRRFLGGAAAAAAGIAATSLLTKGVDASPIRQFGLANYLAQTLPDDAQTPISRPSSLPPIRRFRKCSTSTKRSTSAHRTCASTSSAIRWSAWTATSRSFRPRLNRGQATKPAPSGPSRSIEGRMWNDGNPLTANDLVKTFQYGADPAHAWDFTWFFDGVHEELA